MSFDVTNTIGFCDNPVDTDFLGCKNYYDGLVGFIKNCPSPMTVAIQGDWGTGKSTAMKIVEKELMDEHTIVFNTWKFSKSSGQMLIVPLINLMIKKLDQIGKDYNNYENQFVHDNKVKKVLTSLGGVLFLAGQGMVEKFSGMGNTLDSIKNGLENHEDEISFFDVADELHDEIQRRIDLIYENDKKRIVIFVDDLDRLTPEDAVGLLEDMKNIMDFKNCIFVLALDHKIVMQGLSKKYRGISKEYADRFFDKIIQLPFYLPVNSYKTDQYVKELNNEKNILEEFECDEIIKILEKFHENNPRTIKRLLNLMLFYEKTGEEVLLKYKIECFAINLLQINHTSKYEILLDSLRDINTYDYIKVLKDDNYYYDHSEKLNSYWDDLEKLFSSRLNKEEDYRLNYRDVTDLLKELVNGDCLRLKEVVMATSVTSGNGVTERIQVTDTNYNILNDYLHDLFGCQGIEIVGNNYRKKRFEIEDYTITVSDRYGDHVNVTISALQDNNIVGLEDNLTENISDKINDIYSNHNIPVNEKNDQIFSILCENTRSFCFYNVSFKSIESFLIIGKLLRNLYTNNQIFLREI
ncbi:MAG: KAP family NTPase [Eubacterium sp.]|nr:KAP family NTPase [Eubacterium sp.]